MSDDALENEKLRQEIAALKRPFWKQPSYLTIIVTAAIAVAGYVSTTRSAMQADLISLRQERTKLRQQVLSWQIAENKRQLRLYKEASAQVDKVLFKEYAVGYLNGILASPSGQAAISRIAKNKTQAEQIENFTRRVAQLTLKKASVERKKELKDAIDLLKAE